jgi:hypothetical protein
MSADSEASGLFDIRTAEAFFASAVSKFKKYQDPTKQTKSTEDLLYIIMVLAHLREWIAPGFEFSKEAVAQDSAQQFGIDLFNTCPAFKDLKAICNATKHFNTIQTTASGGLNIDEWESFDDVLSFDNGPATDHFIQTKRGNLTVEFYVSDLVETVIAKYEEWFSQAKES